MDEFIPQTYEELINKCKECGFRGLFSMDNNTLLWRVSKHILLRIVLHNAINDEGYIEEWYIDNDGKEIPKGHWHPMAEEIFNDLRDINDNEIVILRKGIFQSIVILGSKNDISMYKDGLFIKYEILED